MNPEMLPDTLAALTLEREFMLQLPSQAAAELERLDVDDAVAILSRQAHDDTARVWERLSPATAQEYLLALPEDQVTEILVAMNPTRAGMLLGGLDAEERDKLLDGLPGQTRDLIGRVMSHPAGAAGALMDPRVIFHVARRLSRMLSNASAPSA